MHESSFPEIITFVEKYLDRDSESNIIDLNGLSTRDKNCGLVFDEKNWKYMLISLKKDGLDKIENNSVDVIVTGQNLERIKFFWETMKEIGRILKPRGYFCAVVASAGVYGTDGDLYRFHPDGLKVLAEIAGLKVLECNMDKTSSWWNTTIIAQKPGKEPRIKKLIAEE